MDGEKLPLDILWPSLPHPKSESLVNDTHTHTHTHMDPPKNASATHTHSAQS